MFSCYFIIVCAFASVFSAVTKNINAPCSFNEFSCSDGACISVHRVCDGTFDCDDRSDELCFLGVVQESTDNTVLNRIKRQATNCRKDQMKCRDGTCISFDGKCDGKVDCPDGSDESHALCRKEKCQANWFRCTYGACVDGTAPCNGVQECADNSDELLPRCRNETEEVRGRFKCLSGETIPSSSHCDGVKDCVDGSDETVRTCAGQTCSSYLFQCAYGACVDQGSDCNDKEECADGSDEAADLCNRQLPSTPTVPPTSNGACLLPSYPKDGSYEVADSPNAAPGQRFPYLTLNVTCHPGYGVIGRSDMSCQNGKWTGPDGKTVSSSADGNVPLPQCIRFCRVPKSPSVEYRCLLDGNREGFRPCDDYEPTGTIVNPVCRPNYYSPTFQSYIRCINGQWSNVANCVPDCGKVTPDGEKLIIGGRTAKKGELPWHVGIYSKLSTPYMQICGGTILNARVVVSAAHCFWSDVGKQLPAANYAVAAGKIYRPYNNPNDVDAQKTDVKEIFIPPHFQGSEINFQADIAMVVVMTAFIFKPYIKPVCIDFDTRSEEEQLQPGKLGKVAGWGLTAANGNASQILRVVELPFVGVLECISQSPPGFRAYITYDKICAGFGNGTSLCKGDSGGGLAFPKADSERYYLRGLVSTAPNNENLCNAFVLTTFTKISLHENFIRQHLDEGDNTIYA